MVISSVYNLSIISIKSEELLKSIVLYLLVNLCHFNVLNKMICEASM